MTVYYINLALILALAYPLCIYKPSKMKKLAYLIITFGYMWFLTTFRYGIGFDYKSYIGIFDTVKAAGSFSAALDTGLEWGFLGLTWIMTKFVDSYVVMYGIYAALIMGPIVYFIYRHCDDAWFSAWLYVTLTFFYTNTNFIRQCIATSIVLLGYDFLRKKKTVPFLLIVIAAAFFHKTVLILIPVYFFCHIKLTPKMGIFYGSATLILYLFAEGIFNFATNFVYTYYKDSIFVSSFPIVFLLVPFSLFGGCLALYPNWRRRDTDADMLMNLMMFSAIIWLFITRQFILERFSMFVYVFALVAVPSAIRSLKASPEDVAKLEELRQEPDNKKAKGKSKEALAKIRELALNISDHKKYYWSAVVAVLLLTFIYHDFGGNVNEFHGAFPYQSVLSWLNGL